VLIDYTFPPSQQSVGLLWTSDRLITKTSTWQHTTLTTDILPCAQRDLNPKSQQASGRRLTPQNTQPSVS